MTASLWRSKLIPRWGMVKGLKGTRQNLNCSRAIKLTMGLRLYFLKPLMLKTLTESNGGWIHVFLKKGNFLHNFILRKCKASNHQSHLKKDKCLSLQQSVENMNMEAHGDLISFLSLVGRKNINLLAHLLWRSCKQPNTGLKPSGAILLLGMWQMSGWSLPFPQYSSFCHSFKQNL